MPSKKKQALVGILHFEICMQFTQGLFSLDISSVGFVFPPEEGESIKTN